MFPKFCYRKTSETPTKRGTFLDTPYKSFRLKLEGGLRNAEKVPLFVGLLARNFAAVGKKFG